MARQYVRVLEAVVEDADVRLGRLELLGARSGGGFWRSGTRRTGEVPEATLPELFEEQVRKTPDAVAVVFEEQSLSYGELNERANRLCVLSSKSRCRTRSNRGSLFAAKFRHGCGLLATLKAGGAYLPLAVRDTAQADRDDSQ